MTGDVEVEKEEEAVTTISCYVNELDIQTQVSSPANHGLLPKKQTKQTQTIEKTLGFNIHQLRNDSAWIGWTGMTEQFFYAFLELLGERLVDGKKLQRHTKLLLFMTKIKQNQSFKNLSTLFQIGEEKASETFYQVLDAAFSVTSKLVYWPSRHAIDHRMPASFRKSFPTCRAVIDCTEIEIEIPGNIDTQTPFYSSYKARHTIKFLICVAPSGEITFISKAFGGRSTDAEITTQSRFIALLEPGDTVLADKGFPKIIPDAANKGAFIVMPSFKNSTVGNQLSEEENEHSYKVANCRIHVERAIRRMKYFDIFTFVPAHLLPKMSQIAMIIAFFCNNMNDLIDQENIGPRK